MAPKGPENDAYANVSVIRKHSLRSDLLMSPRVEIPAGLADTIYDVTTPKAEKVRRALSERSATPRTTPYIKVSLQRQSPKFAPFARHLYGNVEVTRGLQNTPRRSPRLVEVSK